MSGVLLVTTAAVLVITTRAQDGVFTYALDDAAIHLALAKNLAHHGTFGLVPGVYQSASSSPIFELLLAPLLLISGDGWWTPLLINVIAAEWLLWSISTIASVRRLAATVGGAVAVGALPLGLGLVPLVFTGMEHTLHAAIVVQALLLTTTILRDERPSPRAVAALAGLMFLGTFVRFEMVFVAAGVVVVLVLWWPAAAGWAVRLRTAVATGVAALAPMGLFAVVNRAFGQYTLPNSIVSKTHLGQSGLPLPTASEVSEKVLSDPVLLVAVAVGVAALAASIRRTSATSSRGDRVLAAPLVVMLVTTVLHVVLAEVGWFERYQAYLIIGLAFGALLSLPRLSVDGLRRGAIVVAALCILRVPLLLSTPTATYNVYESEYQLGRFLALHYQGEAIAVNDIGYVGLQHEGDIVDFVGLGSYDMLKARKDGTLDAAFTERQLVAHDVQVIVVHDDFFKNIIPKGWGSAGRWCVTSAHIALSSSCVTFYAREGDQLARLQGAFDAYSAQLPEGIEPRKP
jgi:hypothetical protein